MNPKKIKIAAEQNIPVCWILGLSNLDMYLDTWIIQLGYVFGYLSFGRKPISLDAPPKVGLPLTGAARMHFIISLFYHFIILSFYYFIILLFHYVTIFFGAKLFYSSH